MTKPTGMLLAFVCLGYVTMSKCEVRTVDNASALHRASIYTYTAGTRSLNASKVTDPCVPVEPYQMMWPNGGRSLRTAVRLSIGNEIICPITEDYVPLAIFSGLLTLPQHSGLHDVVVIANSLSTEELEAALYFALQSSIETHLHNTGENVTAVRIILPSKYPSQNLFTETGLPARDLIYILAVLKLVQENRKPVRHAGKPTTSKMPQKIPSPIKDDFIRRLNMKGVVVYEGPIYEGRSILLKGSPHTHNLEQIKRDLVSELETSHNKSYSDRDHNGGDVPCNMSKGDVIVQIGIPLAELAIRLIPNKDSAYSHSLPVNLQLLPTLQDSVAKFLTDKLGSTNFSAVVRFVDPDLDNATALGFVINLAINNLAVSGLDRSLFYGKQIYDHLEGLRIELNTSSEPGGGSAVIQLSSHQFAQTADSQRQTFLQNCKTGQITGAGGKYGDCPLSETFSLALSQPTGEFPSTDKISRLVQEAFAEANHVKLNEAYFTVSLEKRDEIFQNKYGTIGNLLSKHTCHCTTLQDTVSTSATKESESAEISLDVDAAVQNSTFSLYLEIVDPILQVLAESPRSSQVVQESNQKVLRAVGDAFTETNPEKTRDSALTVTLIGYDDDIWTANGRQVTKLDFSVEPSGGESRHTEIPWRHPTRKVLQMHLKKTASARLASDPLTY